MFTRPFNSPLIRAFNRQRQYLLGLALCLGLLGGTAAVPGEPVADIQVKEAWIRWLPANLPGGGYMTVINTGSAPRVLIGASSADYGEISIHQSRVRDGMNEMTPVGSIELKPLVPVRFAEGGYHLMLMQPKRPLKPGERVLITLRFERGSSVEVPFEVRAANSR
ncbi:MAG: periplasmic copper chaperone [Gammaproteobacteria bacterium]|jgi:copper(I)-binding protein|nr:periplasmic copper chaperone [Gammaproteobacteria bacterium]